MFSFCSLEVEKVVYLEVGCWVLFGCFWGGGDLFACITNKDLQRDRYCLCFC